MPQWVDTPEGPVYVDESGAPVGVPDSAFGIGGLMNDRAGGALGAPTPEPVTPVDVPDVLGAGQAVMENIGGFADGLFTPPGAIPSVSDTVKTGGSIGVSESGYSPAKFAQTATGVKDLDAKAKVAAANANATGAASAQPFQEAATQERAAIEQGTEAKVGQADARAKGEALLADLNQKFAAFEEQSNAVAKNASAASYARYEQAVREYAAMEPNQNALFEGLTGAGKTGVLVSAFVQDFLGAKGIKTSAMATWNAAVERSIDMQIQAINKAGRVSESFKALWEMQRAESATEAEARARVRGFYLAQAEKQIASEVSKYDSDLARAQGQKAIAEVQKELGTTFLAIRKMTEDSYQSEVRNNIDVWKARVQAAHQSRSLKLQEEEMAARKLAAGKAAIGDKAKELNTLAIPDPATGKLAFKARSEAEAKEFREGAAAYQSVQENVRKLRDLQAGMGGPLYQGPGNKAITSEYQKRVTSLYTELVADWAKAKNGGRVSDQDIKNAEKRIPLNTLMYRGVPDDVFNDMITIAYDGFNNRARTQSDFSAEEKALIDAGVIQGGIPADFGKPIKDEAESQLLNQDKEVPTQVGSALRGSEHPKSDRGRVVRTGEPTSSPTLTDEDVKAMWETGILQPLPGAEYVNENGEPTSNPGGQALKPYGEQPAQTPYVVPLWAEELDRAVDAVEQAPPAQREKLLNEALTKLSVISTGYDAKDAGEALANMSDPEKNTSNPGWDASKATYAEFLFHTRLAPLLNAGNE